MHGLLSNGPWHMNQILSGKNISANDFKNGHLYSVKKFPLNVYALDLLHCVLVAGIHSNFRGKTHDIPRAVQLSTKNSIVAASQITSLILITQSLHPGLESLNHRLSGVGRDPQDHKVQLLGLLYSCIDPYGLALWVKSLIQSISHYDVLFICGAILKVLKMWSKDGNRSQKSVTPW